jgi:hypothetical protein
MPAPLQERPIWRLQMLVHFLKHQDRVTISFPANLLPTYIGAEVTLQREQLAHLDTAPGFLWWHAGRFGYQAASWQHAARRYSARHGMAIVVDPLQVMTVIVNAFGLNFLRTGGTITQPAVAEPDFLQDLPEAADAASRWQMASRPAGDGRWLQPDAIPAAPIEDAMACTGRIVHPKGASGLRGHR